MKRKFLSIILALLMMISMSVVAFAAEDNSDSNNGRSTTVNTDAAIINSDINEKDGDINKENADVNEENGDNNQEENQLGETAKGLKEQKQEQKNLQDQIENQIEAALLAGDKALAAELEADLEATKANIESIWEQYKASIQARKDIVKARYSNDEIGHIQNAENNIENEDPDATVLGFDSVFSNAASFKFDTPPVIKDGRTLVPVRAITEGFGADVNYVDATKTVTITKDGTVISLVIGSNTATVNGVEVALDTQAGITNDRTYVPLRFVLEVLNLDVQWDDNTRTIEINDPAVNTTAPVI